MRSATLDQNPKGAVEHACKKYVRIESDRSACVYQIYEERDVLKEPMWPGLGLEDLVNIVFASRVIHGLKHPKAQTALGRI